MSRQITVEPEEFHLVDFSAAEIAAIVDEVAGRVGLPPDQQVVVQVNESTPLGRARLAATDPVTLEVESGGFEDPLRPRQLSRANVEATAGRLLMRARDRLDPDFGDPPPDADLALAEATAWDVYATGRLARLGFASQRERRRYHFRIRHGFTDESDLEFERLWNGEDLTWAQVREPAQAPQIAG